VRRMAATAFATAPEVQIDEVRDCGSKRVLLLGRQRAWVEGVSSESVVAEVFEIDARKVRRCQPSRGPSKPSKPPGCGSRPGIMRRLSHLTDRRSTLPSAVRPLLPRFDAVRLG
jgi:hypothetical protein